MSNRRRLGGLGRRKDKPTRQGEPTYWNGEPCEAQRGTAVIADDERFPAYWARHEGLVGQRGPVVRVVYGGHEQWLWDRDGIGWAKVTEGHGSPRWSHANVDIEPGTFEPAS